jgi:hypothetical protein
MLVRSAFYLTDCGRTFAFCSLNVSTLSPSILPVIFSNILSAPSLGYCALPQSLKSRKAVVTEQSGERHELEYPFRPDTPEWYQFWQELTSNPLITSVQGVGESFSGSSFKYSVG